MRALFVATALAVCSSGFSPSQAESLTWDFEDVAVGQLPAHWSSAKAGEGEGSVWKVIEDKTAPAGGHVLAQAAAGPRPLFNLCVADAPPVRDLEISVAFKAVEGKVDQGGGLVWVDLLAGVLFLDGVVLAARTGDRQRHDSSPASRR